MITFKPHPEARYKNDYPQIFKDVASGKIDALSVYRELILDDLFFIVYFVMQVEPANHPFVVQACQEVEDGPETDTLDIWAREHFKSTILTTAEVIQKHAKHGSICISIFSHTRPIAKAFLRSIKLIYQSNELLKKCFPEVFWQDPEKQAPKWSEDDGLILKSHDPGRREASLEAWGLMDGMPTSKHFDHMVYDDVETADVVTTPEVVKKLRDRYDLSQNLGTMTGTRRVIGTFYSHEGLLTYLKDQRDAEDRPIYTVRIKPATIDGTPNGKPVLLSQEKINKLKVNEYVFNCQQLLNPTPVGIRKLDGSLFIDTPPERIPKNITKFLLVDPAGDDVDGSGDAWAFGVLGVNPDKDDIGASDVYITDLSIVPMRTEDAISEIVRMYLRNGMIQAVGVEKVGTTTFEVHIASALKARGRHISQDNKSLYILRPGNRSKVDRIVKALAWPLFNGKIHISTAIPQIHRDRLRQEADKFPYWHDDGLDILSYLYDILGDPLFRYLGMVNRWKTPLRRPNVGVV